MCFDCWNFGPLYVPAVNPKSAIKVPVPPASILIVPAPAVESPISLPSWNISNLLVVELTLAVTPGIFAALICEATFASVVELAATTLPLICMLCPDVTVAPAVDSSAGNELCQPVEPNCTQVFEAVFL